jgi:hypothetical protein
MDTDCGGFMRAGTMETLINKKELASEQVRT